MRRDRRHRVRAKLSAHLNRRRGKGLTHQRSVASRLVNRARMARPVNRARANPARPENQTEQMGTRRLICRSSWKRWPSGGCNSSTHCPRIPPRRSGR
jgi:hypothetical protein